MSYRVVIPTAGTGVRLGRLTRYINKSLVSVGYRPAISRLVEMFPADCEFVIALGHKGNLVRDYLELAHPDLQFIYTYIEPFEGEGSGLGCTLLSCEAHLREPFIFISCDTLVKEQIASPDRNWMAYSEVANASSYRTLELEHGHIRKIHEKSTNTGRRNAYIGLAGIYHYESFWNAMQSGEPNLIHEGEVHGIREILTVVSVEALRYTWFDTGNPETLAVARDEYESPDGPNILEKENEAIWFVANNVIKFSDNKRFITNRLARVRDLKDFIPEVQEFRENMYKYLKVDGTVLSEVVTEELFDELLAHCSGFWELRPIEKSEILTFKNSCLRFYRDKTIGRINDFYTKFDKKDGIERINGEEMPLLNDALEEINWVWLSNGLAGRFHGDLHFENIIWSDIDNKFTFLDWRQDFDGDLMKGDIYYDLAKILHGLIVSHDVIAKHQYDVSWSTDEILYSLRRKPVLEKCERRFDDWVVTNGYDVKKVRVLTAIIFLNIAALHHHPYSLLLYGLGKRMLVHELKDRRTHNLD